jgi:hypothetical protein
VFRSEDRGAHWTSIGPYPGTAVVVLDPTDGDRVYANTTVRCEHSYECEYRGDVSTTRARAGRRSTPREKAGSASLSSSCRARRSVSSECPPCSARGSRRAARTDR